MQPFPIVEYTLEDESPLAELAASAFEQYKHHYADWSGFQANLRRMPNLSTQGEVFVAKDGSALIGAVAYIGPGKPKPDFFKPEWPVMRMLVVSPKARGAGVGRALAEECIQRAKRDCASVLALHTSEIMEVALAMYGSMDFKWHAATPDIHGLQYAVYLKSLALPCL